MLVAQNNTTCVTSYLSLKIINKVKKSYKIPFDYEDQEDGYIAAEVRAIICQRVQACMPGLGPYSKATAPAL